jgi:four helix bundle protein
MTTHAHSVSARGRGTIDTVRTHRDLKAWELSIDLADLTYRKTASLPADERFGLSAQMRRAAVSVSANIAEGAGRDSAKEFRRFLFIARGSLAELETLAIIASRIGLLPQKDRNELLAARNEVARVVQGLINSFT